MAACELYYGFARVFDIASPLLVLLCNSFFFRDNQRRESCTLIVRFHFLPPEVSQFSRPIDRTVLFLPRLTCRRISVPRFIPVLRTKSDRRHFRLPRNVIGMQMTPRRILIFADCRFKDIIITLIAANCTAFRERGVSAAPENIIISSPHTVRINRVLKKINNSVGNL